MVILSKKLLNKKILMHNLIIFNNHQIFILKNKIILEHSTSNNIRIPIINNNQITKINQSKINNILKTPFRID